VSGRRALWLAALAALALRLALLVARGDYIVYDEGYYLLLARSLRAGQGFTLNGLPHVALSPLQPVLVALASAAGVPDLWASRLLAALCGSLLVLPVADLAGRAGGPRAALAAAAFTAASPALMSFVPFFPGESWNLYFGSEPLFLLLAFGAVAAAARAGEGSWKWWLGAGLLAGGSYLARAEGAVLAGTLFVVLAVSLAVRRRGAADWRRFALAAGAGALVAAPYLLYLHGTLGRWVVSGRVQAASEVGEEAPSAVQGARRGGQVLEEFVWQGRPDAFLQALYGLDPSGTRMASQYWGVHREAAPPAAAPAPPSGPADSAAAAAAPAARAAPRRGAADVWRHGLAAVVPWWLAVLALAGLALARRESLVWAFPLAVCAVLPSLLTYVEPRSLLPLAPLAAVYAAVAAMWLAARVEQRWPRAPAGLAALATLALLAPAGRDLVRAWPQTTPLQQVATGRRTVGEYLAQHLPPDSIVMSWHPAVAIWASRPWRVLPYATFERITDYARATRVAAVVFSRFEPSPLPRPPRAFTIVLPDQGGSAAGSRIEVQPVDETPLLFVGRLARVPARAAP
jgi:4-amino-4-deoxy-L-arabinose transferase-like glycosyltransferase